MAIPTPPIPRHPVRHPLTSAIGLALLALSGCASVDEEPLPPDSAVAYPPSEEPITPIQVGTTTRTELLAYAGEPTEVVYAIEDDECWRYRYGDMGEDRVAYRPLANHFRLGDDAPGAVAEFHLLDAVVYNFVCPGDEDNDGVLDHRDECPGTRAGAQVDAKGCELVPEPAPEPLHIVLDDFSIEGAYFDFDRDELKPEGVAALRDVVAKLQGREVRRIHITGHTDAIGSDLYNIDLGRRRAEAARRFLVDAGFDPALITIESKGEHEHIADNDSAEGRARNRRIELVVSVDDTVKRSHPERGTGMEAGRGM